MPRVKKYIRLIRPKHCVKNFLIFLPLIFSGGFSDLNKIGTMIVAFVAFSLVASAVYVINDIRDREMDKLHPVKRLRPIASGDVSVRNAIVYAAVLLTSATILQILISPSVLSFTLLGVYLLINIAYSFGLKNIPILDVVILSAGFLVRVFYGGEVINVEISQWLCLVVLAFSLYLGLGKRRGEIKMGSAKARKVNRRYDEGFLDRVMHVFLTLAVVFYSLWVVEISVSMPLLFWTVPLVMVIVLLYSFDIEKPNGDGDPSSVLFGDKVLMSLVALYVVSVIGIIYVAHA